MSTKYGYLSVQASRRMQGGEMILKHSDDEVERWRRNVWPRIKKTARDRYSSDFRGRKRFLSFSTYSPELNPVEPCWHWMKDIDMANFVPNDVPDLHSRTLESASRLNQNHDLLLSHIKYTKLKL